jgi:hypothetical protein
VLASDGTAVNSWGSRPGSVEATKMPRLRIGTVSCIQPIALLLFPVVKCMFACVHAVQASSIIRADIFADVRFRACLLCRYEAKRNDSSKPCSACQVQVRGTEVRRSLLHAVTRIAQKNRPIGKWCSIGSFPLQLATHFTHPTSRYTKNYELLRWLLHWCRKVQPFDADATPFLGNPISTPAVRFDHALNRPARSRLPPQGHMRGGKRRRGGTSRA